MIILPKKDDKKKELSGDNINKIIKKIDTLKHKHTFCVDFAYSIIIVDDEFIYKIYYYYILFYNLLSNYIL
jgi:hypothetical protein